MALSNYSSDQVNELIQLKQQRLYYLERQQAAFGLNTPPHILMEIEELKKSVGELRVHRELAQPDSDRAPVKEQQPGSGISTTASPPQIGIVTALTKEHAVVHTMLDDIEPYSIPGRGAGRRYHIGRITSKFGQKHVIALALADKSNTPAAVRASQMLIHFPAMRHVIMVGIAGGIPNPHKPAEHVRLGDVVVSDHGGVVKYDLVKEEFDYGSGLPRYSPGFLPRPPSAQLLEAVRLMEAAELLGKREWLLNLGRLKDMPNFDRPPDETDKLFDSIDQTKSAAHPVDPRRKSGEPRVFLGPIASSDTLLKSAVHRDALRDQYGVKAVEMEASGIAEAAWAHEVGFLVVRGVCDYCDSHKNDVWQEYAAAVAAAYTRGLLASMPVDNNNT